MGDQNITHQHEKETIEQIKKQIIDRGGCSDVTVDELLKIVDGLNSFPLGRFLLFHRGLNGFWTHYVVTHPERKKQKLNRYEALLLEELPVSLATQERYRIFKKILQSKVKDGVKMASIPCGLMGELLALDYSSVRDFALYGADVDTESLKLAEKWAEDIGIKKHCTFRCQDAWEINGSFDVIASNGLNFYVKDPKRVVSLYHTFHRALNSGGMLLTSFLTPPPNHPHYSTEWQLSSIPPQAMNFQKILFNYVAQPKFENYLPKAVITDQLKEAGFKKIELFYDRGHLFPTVLAIK
ncbi:MAG: methyltransferase domain-containing protein [Chlamydiales bacterium]|nr:methyltransferase domain-containing protein [Chlamydiales bacterium]